jgi:hypothetical protein
MRRCRRSPRNSIYSALRMAFIAKWKLRWTLLNAGNRRIETPGSNVGHVPAVRWPHSPVIQAITKLIHGG